MIFYTFLLNIYFDWRSSREKKIVFSSQSGENCNVSFSPFRRVAAKNFTFFFYVFLPRSGKKIYTFFLHFSPRSGENFLHFFFTLFWPRSGRFFLHFFFTLFRREAAKNFTLFFYTFVFYTFAKTLKKTLPSTRTNAISVSVYPPKIDFFSPAAG